MTLSTFSWAWRLRIENPDAKLVALYLGDNCDDFGQGQVERETARLWTCLDEESFFEALQCLEDIGVEFMLRGLDDPGPQKLYFQLPVPRSAISREVVPTVKKPRDRFGWLYVLVAGGKTKIGISRKLYDRIVWLQSGNPEKITLEGNFSGPFEQIRLLEREAHGVFADRRVAGEWFGVSPADALEVVRRIIGERGFAITEAPIGRAP